MTESLKVNSSYIGTALSQNVVALCLQKHTMNCTIGYSMLKWFLKYTNFHHLTAFTYWLRFCWIMNLTVRAKYLVHRHWSDGHHGNTYETDQIIRNSLHYGISSYQAIKQNWSWISWPKRKKKLYNTDNTTFEIHKLSKTWRVDWKNMYKILFFTCNCRLLRAGAESELPERLSPKYNSL